MARPSTREQLLAAGLETLFARGFNGCGVQDIAAAAGVPKGSFYNHFESKEAFAVAVLERYWQRGAAGLAGLSDERVPPVERLRRYFDAVAAHIVADGCQGCMITNFSTELADQSRLVRDRLAAIFAGWRRTLESCIREAQRAGDVASDLEAGVLASFILDAWEGAILRAKVDKDPGAFEQFNRVVFDKILV
jgi:TetR/AcrR family transcriptional repressor of nem operon